MRRSVKKEQLLKVVDRLFSGSWIKAIIKEANTATVTLYSPFPQRISQARNNRAEEATNHSHSITMTRV